LPTEHSCAHHHVMSHGVTQDDLSSMVQRALTVRRLLTMNFRFMVLGDIIGVYQEAY
jgi:hypothetical protein